MLKVTSPSIYKSDKVIDYRTAVKKISEIKSKGKTVGLCHGGFDLLHSGHIKHFESAKKLCDYLFVSVTSDKFVTSRKGSGRPIYLDSLRAYSVACIEFVDFVVISDFEKGVEVIKKLNPSYYIKGPDFINKNTPGITAEREAIKLVGGEIKYTNDPKLSTTELIRYIKEEISDNKFLVIIDRDGTLIKNDDFFGKEADWRKKLIINNSVVKLLYDFQLKTNSVKIVVSNQSGVARRYFSCKTVENIHSAIDGELKKKGVIIDDWQYCPDVDLAYATSQGINKFDKKYVCKKTKRKPSNRLVFDSLKKIRKDTKEFTKIVVIGNKLEDKQLSDNLDAFFIDVNKKSYGDLKKEFTRIHNP